MIGYEFLVNIIQFTNIYIPSSAKIQSVQYHLSSQTLHSIKSAHNYIFSPPRPLIPVLQVYPLVELTVKAAAICPVKPKMIALLLAMVLFSVPDALVSESSAVCEATPTRVLMVAASEAVREVAAETSFWIRILIWLRAPITSKVKQTWLAVERGAAREREEKLRAERTSGMEKRMLMVFFLGEV